MKRVMILASIWFALLGTLIVLTGCNGANRGIERREADAPQEPISRTAQATSPGSGDTVSDATTNEGVEAVQVMLESISSTGISGYATITETGSEIVEVKLVLHGLEPHNVYDGGIYRGSCANEQGTATNGITDQEPWGADRRPAISYMANGALLAHDPGATADEEDVVYTLTSVTADPHGNGTSFTAVPMALRQLLADEPTYVDIHEGSSRVACGDLPHKEAS